jgi:hypothetical protein
MLLPPMERRAILRDIELRVPLHLTEITGAKPGTGMSRAVEGVIAERGDSPYEHRRSPY